MPAKEPRLFLDCDGVLADFDMSACRLLGMKPKDFIATHGRGAFWSRLAKAKNFYGSLPEMPDARVLFEGVEHLKPTILTGLPIGNWAAEQKVRWSARYFPGTRIITTMARDKRDHAREGDVLVDDMVKHRHLWEEVGGVFVHHTNAAATIEALATSVMTPIGVVTGPFSATLFWVIESSSGCGSVSPNFSSACAPA